MAQVCGLQIWHTVCELCWDSIQILWDISAKRWEGCGGIQLGLTEPQKWIPSAGISCVTHPIFSIPFVRRGLVCPKSVHHMHSTGTAEACSVACSLSVHFVSVFLGFCLHAHGFWGSRGRHEERAEGGVFEDLPGKLRKNTMQIKDM